MALKGDRYEFQTDITYFMNEVAERGGIVCFSTVGSGSALDQSQALVTYASSTSGNVPVGMLLCDMVNLDLTRQHINFHRNEMQKGGKVNLGIRGWWVTNFIVNTPAVGDGAYLSSSGYIIPYNINKTTASNYIASINTAINPRVGKFLSSKDEDGYSKVEVDL